MLSGFVHNGMIDSNTHRWPDFDKIIQTCRRNVTHAELKLIHATFPMLYNEMMEKGIISDEFFDEHNYPVDKDIDGETDYIRHIGISDEKCQRAKAINHRFQRELRKERLNSIEEARISKEDKLKQDCLAMHEWNMKCEQKLFPNTENNISERDYENLTMEQFSKCMVDELKAFLFVRMNDTMPANKKSKDKNTPKLKGKLVDAKNGAMNLIKYAFTHRMLKVKLENGPTSIINESIHEVNDNTHKSIENKGKTNLSGK